MDISTTWENFLKERSQAQRDKLIVHYLPIVERVAKQVHSKLPTSVELEDLKSEGVFGLIDAIEKFEPERGFKFETYASHRVKGAVLDSLRRQDWMPRTSRALIRELEVATTYLHSKLGRNPTDRELLDHLVWDDETLREVREDQGREVQRLDEPVDADDPTLTLADVIADNISDASDRLNIDAIRDRLVEAVAALPERERTVLVLYYIEQLKFEDIGTLLNVTESRACQIQTEAIAGLRSHLRRN